VVRHKITFEKIWTCLLTLFTAFKLVFHPISLAEGPWILSVQFCILVISASWSRWISHCCLMFGKPPGRWAVESTVRSSFLPDSTIQLIPFNLWSSCSWFAEAFSFPVLCSPKSVSWVQPSFNLLPRSPLKKNTSHKLSKLDSLS
jgi:hypothetical protein